ncbi:MAG: NAD(P)H-dependent oxidoreductase [Erysipelotrichaceae bacterium]|nr:NAD(P)H-dependent oxidoreductase [Erysipelotrichaceae bacterium]
MILYINACVREGSRTRQLAEYLLDKMDDEIVEVRVHDLKYPKMDEGFINLRNAAAINNEQDAPCLAIARQFASADTVVVAAPYWDLSFPSALKTYFEQACVVGVTFAYTPDGLPYGMCKAKKLYYVTTAGGPIDDISYGYGYIKALCHDFYDIPETFMIKAEELDMDWTDVDKVMAQARADIDALFAD